jgi:chemotaxis protein CheY-P-specific phosphatase CheC
MDQRKRIDKILDAAETRIQDEVGTLLGTDFSVVGGNRELVSKAEAFERLSGKQICAKLDITGDVSGKGCLLVGIKDAIRLGGTLIMLPDLELQEVIGREEYREEVEDSYGEIANIISGSITKAFEEMYPKACRFIRKEQEVLIPAKVEVESDTPVENQTLYSMASSMLMDGKQMGDLIVLFPAAIFELEEEAAAAAAAPPESQTAAAPGNVEPTPSDRQHEANGEGAASLETPNEEGEKKPQKPKIDAEKQKKKVDRLLAECLKRLSGEVGALLGVDVQFEDEGNSIVGKEDFFAEKTVGKQILTDMEVVGDLQDTCYFSIGKKDAIHLGGVLIMLPPSELVNVINEEDFSDDGRDAYGEVANIVSGVYTAVFEEQYSEKLRFIRKEFREVVPPKVVTLSDKPIANQSYYCQSMQLMVAGKQLGLVHMLFPAQLLHLDIQPEEAPASVTPPAAASAALGQKVQDPAGGEAVAMVPESKARKLPSKTKENAEKQKKLVDKLLIASRDKVAEEVSALLGTEVELSNINNRIVNKESFFLEEVSGKQVSAHMDVVGEATGESYLIVNLRDAIRIGGVLIMLPSQELESVVNDEIFGDDTKDAYSEVANIIAGVYTAIFEEQYSKKIRFVRKDLQQIVPMKVEAESAEPFVNGDYYVSSSDLSIGGSSLGKVNLVFPLELFELDGLLAVEEEISGGSEEGGIARSVQSGRSSASSGAPDILLIGDDEAESAKIAAVLEGMDFAVKALSFKDNVHNYIPGELKAIYLVMHDVNEQAFGAAIKISSSCTVPIIAAGPAWTRTKVIKAVKYGIRDILLTPSSKSDIEENVTNNLLKLAA